MKSAKARMRDVNIILKFQYRAKKKKIVVFQT